MYHILYKVIEKEKNIKWFGSLKDEKNYSKEEREKISEILKEKNMYLFNEIGRASCRERVFDIV